MNILLSKAKSKDGNFEITHHSAAGVIELKQLDTYGPNPHFWMDYEQFKELEIFILSIHDSNTPHQPLLTKKS